MNGRCARGDRPGTDSVFKRPNRSGFYAGLTTVIGVPDEIFAHPMLAEIYDAFEGERDDLGPYLDLVHDLGARRVLDVGCGTGSLAVLLGRGGVEVIGVDPAAASLAVARNKQGADQVSWVHGDATTLPPLHVDVALITGNVAQVFLTDQDWIATLRGIRASLTLHGFLVFETRRPERRAWYDWALDTEPVIRDLPGVGQVEQRSEVTDVVLPLVSFRQWYRFVRDDQVISSSSTLRFRSRDEIENSLASAGFAVSEVRDAPDRPGQEYVFIAKRSAER